MNYTKLGNDIVEWINNYAINANIKSLVIGVSGGVDSGLVSTLCARTGLRTIAVSMPIDQESNQLKRARNHCNWLDNNFANVQTFEINLSQTYDVFKDAMTYPKDFTNALGLANSKSRLRMVTLYQIASYRNGLVVGTGNKVEDFGVGFYTKYGDGGVDISPIADLTKSEVRNLAKELGIIDEIVNAVPTDGLWEDNRSDEDQIGASYEELEWAMEFNELLQTHGYKIEECTARELEVLKIYNKFNIQNKHKMVPIPTFKKNNEY
jgi:NAD+ synthase